MTSKWFLASKTILGLAFSSVALMQELPGIPPTWQPWIALAANAALLLNRTTDKGATPLTLLPKTAAPALK